MDIPPPAERLLSPTSADGANDTQTDRMATDPAMRPLRLKDFIGQDTLCQNLSVFIAAARGRGNALDHILFHGPPGLGKTTLAHIVAKELGVGFRTTSGPVIARAGDLAAILTNLEAFDVLFIDEIHRLNPMVEEILYPAMEDFQLDLMIGEGPAARNVRIDLPPFTLIGATTRSGLLTTPLRERFGIPLRLEYYTPTELEHIISRNAQRLGIAMSREGALEIAKRARGTPRVAGRLLRRVCDFAFMGNSAMEDDNIENATNIVDSALADEALHRLDVDERGLDNMDRRYLCAIAEHYGGGPVGVETLAAALSEQRGTIEDVLEPYLIQQGLLMRTPRGRVLTQNAWEHLGLPIPRQTKEQVKEQVKEPTKEQLPFADDPPPKDTDCM